MAFPSASELHEWLVENAARSQGIWLRIYKQGSGVPSVTFEEVLDEGLCVGWSESTRMKGDDQSYLQRFTPRRRAGTTSQRNQEHVSRLLKEGRMTPAGLKAINNELVAARPREECISCDSG